MLSCNNLTKNAMNLHENINKENNNLNENNQEYLEDIEHYRNETAKIIESNSQNILVFKAKIYSEKDESKYNYRHSIFLLELQNGYMKMKLDDYKPEGKVNWEIFKAEYTRQMEELGKEFADFTEAI